MRNKTRKAKIVLSTQICCYNIWNSGSQTDSQNTNSKRNWNSSESESAQEVLV